MDAPLRCVYADTGRVVFLCGCVDVSQFYRKSHTFLNINSQNLQLRTSLSYGKYENIVLIPL